MIPQSDRTIEIPTVDDYPVRGDLYIPATGKSAGTVVLCHGFKGYKTWGFFPYVSARLRDAGFLALSIDFSFNGTHPIKDAAPDANTAAGGSAGVRPIYPRPDLFRINTISRERNDLDSVIRFIKTGKLGPHVAAAAPIGLFGHSRGGVVSFLHAVSTNDVDALCTWSIPDHANIFDARQIARWRAMGDYDFTNAADGAKLSVSPGYLDDLEKNGDAYDLAKQAPRLTTPHLIVHGETDLAVDVESARALYRAETNLDDKKLLIVRTGHLFGVIYPSRDGDGHGGDAGERAFSAAGTAGGAARRTRAPAQDEPADALVRATDATVEWFTTYLAKGE